MSNLTNKEREKLPESAFAFPKERKEPLIDARHVQAWKRIKSAARKFGVELQEKDWHELFTRNGRSVPSK